MVDLGPIETTDDPAVAHEIERELLSSLSSINRQSGRHHRTFCLRDEESRLAAGLTCSTAYGWLHVETLWVAEALRNRGLGRKLMNAAEAFAREHGCHKVWLDTSNPGAFAFYQSLGYDVFGKLDNGEGEFPDDHRRWFLHRSL